MVPVLTHLNQPCVCSLLWNVPVMLSPSTISACPDTPPPTLCVQPAMEPDWATNPFELNAVNEHLYGRGTSDNKVGKTQ